MSRYFISQAERWRISRLVSQVRDLQRKVVRGPFFELKEQQDIGAIANIKTGSYFDIISNYAPLFFGLNEETVDIDNRQVLKFFDNVAKETVERLERIIEPKMTLENREIMARKFEGLAQELTVGSIDGQGYVCMWGATTSLDPRKEHLKYVGMTWKIGASPSFSGGVVPGEDFNCKCQMLVIKQENARAFRVIEKEGAVVAQARVSGGVSA